MDESSGNFLSVRSLTATFLEPDSMDSLRETASLRELLEQGNGFDPRLRHGIELAAGRCFTKAGLLSLYSDVVEAAVPVLSHVRAAQTEASASFAFQVSWLDEGANVVAYARRSMSLADDGLTLSREKARVEPSHRGLAIATRMLVREVSLVRALSGRSGDVLTVRAADSLGRYVWAAYGFELAGDDGSQILEELRDAFPGWLDEQAIDGMTAEAAARLKAFARDATLLDFANLTEPGLRASVVVEGSKSACELGKAFLIERCPPWRGVLRAQAANPNAFGYATRQLQTARAPGGPVSRAALALALRKRASDEPLLRMTAIEQLAELEGRLDPELVRLALESGSVADAQEARELLNKFGIRPALVAPI
ncbi:MAG: hypothetical protein HY791_17190 [Deltaproteobacteria bacterium]|nr:hypothetical protein [Deltaproteobacteria bacterium]